MTRPEPARYAHAEAFCVMCYRSDDGTETEFVWNSRDGVTPFVITLRSGKPATHADWDRDQRMPEDWTPPPGMRRFTDLTRARARELAARQWDTWAADPAAARHLARLGDRDQAITDLAASYLSQPGAPDLTDDPGAAP